MTAAAAAAEGLRHDIQHQEEVGGLVYRVARSEEDIKRAMDFMFEVFLKDEPATKSMGGYGDSRPEGIVAQIDDILRDGVTVLVVDPAKGNLLVGMRASITIAKSSAPERKETMQELLSQYPKAHALIMYLFDEALWPPDVFRRYPGHEKVFDFFALGTRPEYRGRGIAKELVRQAIKVARRAGCDCVMVFASHEHSRRIFQKLGMGEISRIFWSDVSRRKGFEGSFENVEFDCFTGHFMSLK